MKISSSTSIKAFRGSIIQTINVNKTDFTYNDLLKYITIPPQSRFRNINNQFMVEVCVKKFIKFYHNTSNKN